ncbi:metal-sensitive transcriptional regulator [Alkalibacter saccharofermentans]|uniref:DNA-binding transcriptional regulator, FrmR family n=1 Tax=Alkalibacter saccharofermentans DSM 14828 TaxID=1120975 RepID=A0A1M4S4E5_9FIRM|nr:metal-sensitive transcriptional regulator [Alkalibacter saccharofermentans]SHE27071.1 DNA-binding transcriptional regulator, FrmR family [Alkalibacter saccharofermentans DSM 14828]
MNESKKNILIRLNRIEGQIRGIQKMIENDEECKSVLIQLSAVKSALDSTSAIILDTHAKKCLRGIIESKDEMDIEELMDLMKKFLK